MLTRKKHGFEVPIRQWLLTEFTRDIEDLILDEPFIEQQNIFHYHYLKGLNSKLRSPNPEDSHAQVWAILVFQKWWKQHLE